MHIRHQSPVTIANDVVQQIAESVSWQSPEDFRERGAFSQLALTVLEGAAYKVGLVHTSAALGHYGQFPLQEDDEHGVLRFAYFSYGIPPAHFVI